ncbi:CMGC family protein kinase [Tritrichomonas foetus]|uniref:non-specific serine/threonine protein kinase n=1 Tax=Tritrichomonas foetus TaxID=1144522 RepID=A0A1J4JLF6_9EUKA|nr:CMGC family protein kinase [Tritrichomonas foetus]|eukprot:OHS98381.1 CMGC family protein kinase [Tritrichomonas foetus]
MNKPKIRMNNHRPQPSVAISARTHHHSSKAGNFQRKPLTSREKSFYRPIKVLGKGAFGIVYCAKGKDGNMVAVKKVTLNPHYKNRELDTLKMLNHPNCIRLIDEFTTPGHKPKEVELNIVMDYLPMSLHNFALNYRKNHQYTPIFYVKLFSYQIFTALSYLHATGITHRDIKPENVLIDPETGELKICDFGSAKCLQPGEKSVSYIASRYYRAPELIYGCEKYTPAVDIWAAGCVIAELLTAGSPLFAGSISDEQINEIIAVLGPPTKSDMASFEHPPVKVRGTQKTTLENVLPPRTPPDVMDLLKSILVYNPTARSTANECMRHPCFDELFTGSLKMPSGKKLPPLQRPDDI